MTFVLVAGGTGGHVCPAWALAEALHKMGKKVIFYTDPRGQVYIPTGSEIDVQVLPLCAPSQGKINFILALGRTFLVLLRSVQKNKVNSVIGFGGYPTLAWGLVAVLKGIPLLLHEQNVRPGRTNRLLTRWAQKVAVTFPTNQRSSSITLTGMPLRPDFQAMSYQPASPEKPFRVFIIGGSQGAKIFSTFIPAAIAGLSIKHQQRLEVVHQCRPRDIESTQALYQKTAVQFILKSYFEDVADQLTQAHLVISRAGASTLAEILTVGRPALLIPFPYAQDDHQTANAEQMVLQGGFWKWPEKDLTIKQLTLFLERAMETPAILLEAAESLNHRGHKEAIDTLLKLVLE